MSQNEKAMRFEMTFMGLAPNYRDGEFTCLASSPEEALEKFREWWLDGDNDPADLPTPRITAAWAMDEK